MPTRRLRMITNLMLDLRDRYCDVRVAGRHEDARLLDSAVGILATERARLWKAANTVRRFEVPGRVPTALTRMVDDVFATMRRREEACDAGDDCEVERLEEVEKAQRVRLHDYWRIDPVSRADGTWTVVTRDKRVWGGKGMHLPATRAVYLTRDHLIVARADGRTEGVRRLEEEERLLMERGRDLRYDRFGLTPPPVGFLAPPIDHAVASEGR